MMRALALAIVSFALAVPSYAKTITLTVDAKSGPWSVKINPKMPYGIGDAGEPSIFKGLEPDSGNIEIYPQGKVVAGGKEVSSVGDVELEVDDGTGKKKKRFPSFYTPKVLYPAYAAGLVATFVDAGGRIVGRPIMVGEGVRVPIPDLATGISFGLNDDSFADNDGSFTVDLVIPD